MSGDVHADLRAKAEAALKAERSAADLNGYYEGSNGTREDYEKARAETDAVVIALLDKKKELRERIEKALTTDEISACAFAVAHMIDKHGYSSIVSRTEPRVGLEELYKKLAALLPSTEGTNT